MNPTDEMFVLALVAISIVGLVCIGLIITFGICIFRRFEGKNQHRADPPHFENNNPPNNEEITNAQIYQRLKGYHEEDERRVNRERLENIAFILYGFAIATAGLAIPYAIAQQHAEVIFIDAGMAVGFFIFGGILLLRSRRFR